jgi:hypothetical protein
MGDFLICLTPYHSLLSLVILYFPHLAHWEEKGGGGKGKEKTNLHLNIQHNTFASPRQILNHSLTRAIPISTKHSMLHKGAAINHLLEFLHANIIVVHIARLAGARLACSVRDGSCEDRGVAF